MNTLQKSLPPPTSARDLRFKLQNIAVKLLPDHRVGTCCRARVPEQETVNVVKYEGGGVGFSGLQQCNNVWVCPVCASRISEERRGELQTVVTAARSEGVWVVHATFTMRHNRYNDVHKLLHALSSKGAWGKLTSGARWTRFNRKWGYVGRVRALEITHGDNGWHPHLHVLFFLETESRDRDDLHYDLARMWLDALEKVGLDGEQEVACFVTDHDGDIAEYVSKHGHLPKDVEERALEKDQLDKAEWSLAHEITKQVVKRSRSKNGRSPFALLYDAGEGDKQAGRLFVQFAGAMKGQNQLVISQSLRKRYMSDQHADQIADQPPEVLLEILPGLWQQVVKYRKRAEVLSVAQQGIAPLKEWLHELDLPPALTAEQVSQLTPPPLPAAGGVIVDYESEVVHFVGPPPGCIL